MPSALSQIEIDRYRVDGVAFPFRALDDGGVAAALSVISRIDTLPGAERKGVLLHQTHFVSKTFADICRHPRVLDRVESVIGPNILVWGSNLFLKEPRSTAYVSCWNRRGSSTTPRCASTG